MRTLTAIITAVVLICALDLGRAVLIPITLAILLSFLLAPLVDLLRRLKLGKLPSVLVAVLLALTVIAGMGTLIGTQIAQLANELPQYQAAVEKKIGRVQEVTIGRADTLFANITNAFKRVTPAHKENVPGNPGSAHPSEKAPMPVAVQEPPVSPVALAQRFLAPVLSPLETTGIVLVVAVFILLQREDLRDRLIRLFGSRDLHRTTVAIDEAAHRLSRYFLAQFGINLCAGVVISVGLAVIGVPGAILFGVLTALLRFVPYVGTWIAAVFALALAATGPDWSMLLWTLALFGATDLLTGQVIEPLVYGHSTGLSPVAVIVAAIFWSWIWGPVGLVLSTPLTLCLVILGRHVDGLEFLEVLFGDQPALTPAANFYQRILADDPDEALKQAEALMKDMRLVDYYDTVVLAGMRLARNDLMRGVIQPDQLERIREALLDVIDGCEDLEELARPEPAVPDAEKPRPDSGEDDTGVEFSAGTEATQHTHMAILCIAGRGALDELLAAATVQLLQRQGMAAETAGYERFSRRRAGEIEVGASTTICVVSLDAGQSTAYLRILLRRLHQRAPLAALVLGFPSGSEEGDQESRGTPAFAASTFSQLIAHLHPREQPDEPSEQFAAARPGVRIGPKFVQPILPDADTP